MQISIKLTFKQVKKVIFLRPLGTAIDTEFRSVK